MPQVILRVYDISGGMASNFSTALVGFHIKAIYHTSLQVYGKEYLYGGGIVTAVPGTVPSGNLI